MQYHYFYKITNLINNHFYYGVHSTTNLDDGYMGSGKRLHYAYKKYGIENFNKEILKFFNSRKEAFMYESEFVNEVLVKDPNCYNIQRGGSGWNTVGLVTVRDKDNNTFDVPVDDERYLSGELVGVTKGKVTVKDNIGNTYSVDKNDPKYLSGEYVHNLKGTVTVIDNNRNTYRVSLDDPRYLSGEFKPLSTGSIHVKDNNGNYYQVYKDDPRYLSGELVPVYVKTIKAIDDNQNILFVKENDERLLTGKLQKYIPKRQHTEEYKTHVKNIYKKIKHQQGEKNSQFGTCWIYKIENDILENKKIKKEDLDIYFNNGWIKGRKMYIK